MFAKVEIVTREIKDAFLRQPLHHVVNYRKNDYDKTKANWGPARSAWPRRTPTLGYSSTWTSSCTSVATAARGEREHNTELSNGRT